MKRVLTCAAIALLLAGCGDDPTGPDGPEVEFPTAPPAFLEGLCIRGQMVPPATVSGNLSPTDCVLPDDTFFEGYRVRVAATATVTFRTNAQFDPFLILLRVNDLNDPESTEVVASDDDSGGGVQSLITFQLFPNTEYVIVINGFAPEDIGPYEIQASVQ